MNDSPIGIFDSGVGGLSVLRDIAALLPSENLLYLADQANVPYGHRPLEEVRGFSEGIARYLLAKGAKLVVVACHTASGAALYHLRESFPGVPFVGIEPAVKPAALGSRVKAIGVLATPATFEGPLFARVVDQFARDVRLVGKTCPGLVEIIEAGEVNGERIRRYLEVVLHPLLEEGIDALVLGCTHYPFALETIREIVGPGVAIVDPCPGVARQVRRVLEERGLSGSDKGAGERRYFTSGSPGGLEKALKLLLCEEALVGRVRWVGGELEEV